MIQANERSNAAATLSSSQPHSTTEGFSRHTSDVSEASSAEFERLMAAMGYRRTETTDQIK